MMRMTQESIIEAQRTGEIYVILYSHWEKVQNRNYKTEISKALKMINALEMILED